MGNYQVLSEQIERNNEALKEGQQTLGALHVLIRLALAEAESAGAKDAVNTLNIADNLILRGHINGGQNLGDVVFGKGY